MDRECNTHGEKRNAYRILVGKPEGKRPLGRPRHRWEDNIKMDLREIGWGGMGRINLTQDRDWCMVLVKTVINIRDTQNVGKFLSSWATGGYPRRTQLRGVSGCSSNHACVAVASGRVTQASRSEGKGQLKGNRLGIHIGIILKRISEDYAHNVRMCIGFNWPRTESNADCLKTVEKLRAP
jgi:hypothetical protein